MLEGWNWNWLSPVLWEINSLETAKQSPLSSIIVTFCIRIIDNALDIYSRGARFEFIPGHRLLHLSFSLWENYWVLPHLGRNSFLPNPFHFNIRQSFYHSTLYCLHSDRAINNPQKKTYLQFESCAFYYVYKIIIRHTQKIKPYSKC
jgi:hypothetical protein